MVLLHALENEQIPPQISQDGDIIANVRADPNALHHVVEALETLDFQVQTITPSGIAHRYFLPAEPRPVVIDVLVPEGLGEKTNLTTTPPGRTIEVPAGTQALHRSEVVTIVHEDRT